MSRFQLIATNIDTGPLALNLHMARDLWDANPERRTYPGSPHTEMVDITARYMPPGEISPETRALEHRNVFWPAFGRLPALRPLVFALMARVAAVELGSILITKLPPGGVIQPHTDAGSWAPEFYNCKAHLTVSGAADVSCADDTITMQAGECWTFDNLLPHAVANLGEVDRIAAIVSMRVE